MTIIINFADARGQSDGTKHMWKHQQQVNESRQHQFRPTLHYSTHAGMPTRTYTILFSDDAEACVRISGDANGAARA